MKKPKLHKENMKEETQKSRTNKEEKQIRNMRKKPKQETRRKTNHEEGTNWRDQTQT